MTQEIQHYDVATKTFTQPLNYKIKKLLELSLVTRITDGLYQVNPIPGYNITTYRVQERFGRLLCNCQNGKNNCAHAQAVRIYREQTESREQQLHVL